MKKINESGQSMVLALVFLTVLMGMAAMVEQCPRRGGVQVMVQPTADAPPVDTQFGGEVAEGMARVQVQQSQGAPQDGSVVGIVQLLTQAETLLRGQVQVTHDHPPGAGRTGAGLIFLIISTRSVPCEMRQHELTAAGHAIQRGRG